MKIHNIFLLFIILNFKSYIINCNVLTNIDLKQSLLDASEFMNKNDYNSALKIYLNCLIYFPNNFELLYNIGSVLLFKSSFEESGYYLEYAIINHPECYTNALLNLGVNRFNTNDSLEAYFILTKALECDPLDQLSIHNKNILHQQLNKYINLQYDLFNFINIFSIQLNSTYINNIFYNEDIYLWSEMFISLQVIYNYSFLESLHQIKSIDSLISYLHLNNNMNNNNYKAIVLNKLSENKCDLFNLHDILYPYKFVNKINSLNDVQFKIVCNQTTVFKDNAFALYEILHRAGLNVMNLWSDEEYGKSIELENTLNKENIIYIIFGIQFLPMIPKRFILINLEQNDSYRYLLQPEHLILHKQAEQIWDISLIQMNFWKTNKIISFIVLPFNPKLIISQTCRNLIKTDIIKPIDVLFYGSYSEKRNELKVKLQNLGLNVVFYLNYSLFGNKRTHLISQSKIVLNIQDNKPSLMVHRINYLLAFGKCIVSEKSNDEHIDKLYENSIVFSDYENIPNVVNKLIKNETYRLLMEKNALNHIIDIHLNLSNLFESLNSLTIYSSNISFDYCDNKFYSHQYNNLSIKLNNWIDCISINSLHHQFIDATIYNRHFKLLSNQPKNINSIENIMDRNLFIRYLNNYLNSNSTKYLQFGCRDSSYNYISIKNKICVDPLFGNSIKLSIDKYLNIASEQFDIIFVRDIFDNYLMSSYIQNFLRLLSFNGFLLIYGIIPISKAEALYPIDPNTIYFVGDIWKTILLLINNNQLEVFVLDFDYGIAVIRKKRNFDINNFIFDFKSSNITFDEFNDNKINYLNLISFEQFHIEINLLREINNDIINQNNQLNSIIYSPLPSLNNLQCDIRNIICNSTHYEFNIENKIIPKDCINFKVYPISIGIPISEIVSCIPQKSISFAQVDPNDRSSYIFGPFDEKLYKFDYQRSYFAITKKKSGWDCLRHYEILSSGTIPIFENIENSPNHTLAHLPKELLIEAKNLLGVNQHDKSINFDVFNHSKYYEIVCKLHQYTKKYLTTSAIANYILKITNNQHVQSIIYLSQNDHEADYIRDMVLHGFRQIFGANFVDFKKIPHLYKMNSNLTVKEIRNILQNTYGYGYSYAFRLDNNLIINRDNIKSRIVNHEFDLVIFGSVHRGLPFINEVLAHYSSKEIIFIDGEDYHEWNWVKFRTYELLNKGFYFMREIPDQCPF